MHGVQFTVDEPPTCEMVRVCVSSFNMPPGVEAMKRSVPWRCRSPATVLPGKVQPNSHSTVPSAMNVP